MQTLQEVFENTRAQWQTKELAPIAAHPIALAAEAMSDPIFGTGRRGGSEAEQYQHNQGSVFSAVSIPAKRIADRPAFVGRMVDTSQKHRFRKSLKYYCQEGIIRRDALPQYLKEVNPENVEIVENHPLIQALNDPNDLYTRWQLFYTTAMSAQIVGKGYWLGFVDDGRVKILYLPAHWVKPNHKSKAFGEWLVQPPGSTKPPIPVPRENMAYFSFPDPADPFGVLAPMRQMAKTILADESIQTAQEVAFKNGIFPIHAVTVGDESTEMFPGGGGTRIPELKPAQRRQLQEWIRRQYQGAVKSGTPIILDALLQKIEKITETPSEMAFQEAGEMTEARVYKGFGVNPISAGQVEGANRASSAIADLHLVTNTINPILTMMSQVVTKTLCPHFARDGEKLVFWMEPAEAHDPELLLQKWEFAADNHSVTRNEIRQSLLNLPPMDGLDDIPLPIGVSTGQSGIEFVEEGDEPADKSFQSEYRKTAETLWLKQHAEHEKELSAVIASHIREHVNAIADEIEQSDLDKGLGDWLATLFSPQKWLQKLKDAVRKMLAKMAVAGALGEMTLLPQPIQDAMGTSQSELEEFTVNLPPEVASAIGQVLKATLDQPYWQKINETTRDRVAKILEDGINAGDSIKNIAKRIREELGEDAGMRGDLIARTEVTNILNAGHWAVRQDLESRGLVSGAEWLTTGDAKVRGNDPHDEFSHVAVHGQKIRAGELFDVDGESAPWPGHYSLSVGNRCNCFLPDTIVEGRFDSAMRSFYDGEIVEVVMRSGRRLSVTPNHPILTKDGFVGAGALKKGDKVIADALDADTASGVLSGGDNVNHAPAAIEKVFQTLMADRAVAGVVEVHRSQMDDFHGDGAFIKGDVDVVRSYGSLLRAWEAGIANEVGELGFPVVDSVLPSLGSFRSLAPFGKRMVPVAGGFPRGRALPLDKRAVLADGFPLEQFGGTPAARLNAVVTQDGIDDLSGCSVSLSESLDRRAAVVGVENRGNVEQFLTFGSRVKSAGFATIAEPHSATLQAVSDCRMANAEFLSELIDGRSRRVFLDEVAFVQIKPFVGHVYDTSSETGLIIANGLFSSNCRCTSVSLFSGVVPLENPDEDDE